MQPPTSPEGSRSPTTPPTPSRSDRRALVAAWVAIVLALSSLAIVGVRNVVTNANLRRFCRESHAGVPLLGVLEAARRRGLSVESVTQEELSHGDQFDSEDVLDRRAAWFGWRGHTSDEPIATAYGGVFGSERACAIDHRGGVVVATRLLVSDVVPPAYLRERDRERDRRPAPPRSPRYRIRAPDAAAPSAAPAQ